MLILIHIRKLIELENMLPPGLTSYIPSFRIFRMGIVRDVDPSITLEEIREAISWPGESIRINNIET